MKKFVFKSVFIENDLFCDVIDSEIVTDQSHVDSIEDILAKYGYPQQIEGVYDDDNNDEDVSPFNDFDYDIIDAYEQSVSLGALKQQRQKEVKEVDIKNDNAKGLEEEQAKGDDDEERGTSEEEK